MTLTRRRTDRRRTPSLEGLEGRLVLSTASNPLPSGLGAGLLGTAVAGPLAQGGTFVPTPASGALANVAIDVSGMTTTVVVSPSQAAWFVNSDGNFDASFTIDWGDGSTSTSGTWSAQDPSSSLSHDYAAAGRYAITVTVKVTPDTGTTDTSTTDTTTPAAPSPDPSDSKDLTMTAEHAVDVSSDASSSWENWSQSQSLPAWPTTVVQPAGAAIPIQLTPGNTSRIKVPATPIRLAVPLGIAPTISTQKPAIPSTP